MRRQIRIDPAFAIALIYLLLFEHSVWGLLSLLAAALHEIGHLSAACLLHIRPAQITVGALGARIGFSQRLLSYRDEFLIAAAGPAVNLICLPLCLFGLRRLSSLDGAGERLLFFAAASLVLALLNLLPLRSFDGGRMLRALCAVLLGDRAADRILHVTTAICGILLWCCAVSLWFSASGNLSFLLFSAVLLIRVVTNSFSR